MARRKYTIKPYGIAGMSAEISENQIPLQYMLYDYNAAYTKNVAIRKGVATKRPGLTSSIATVPTNIYGIADYVAASGSIYNLFLSDTDLCMRETGTGNTYSFLTPTYTTGTIASIAADTPSAGKSTVTGSGTDWVTEGIAADDQFIMDLDHDSDSELDANWATVESVTDATHLVLSSNYTKNGTLYKLRKVFSAPIPYGGGTDVPDRWSFCTVGDKFCFTNINEHVWYWDNSTVTYATALDSTNATTYMFAIEFADRLILAHKAGSPTRIQWSKNNDPTDWTDPTAGIADLLTSGAEITGLGKIGSYLVVYTSNSIIFGYKTGISTAPIAFMPEKPGVGCWFGTSIVDADGTNFFASRNNFYKMEGDKAIPIGNPIANEVFDNIGYWLDDAITGTHYQAQNEIIWRENTGGRMFVYNYRKNIWTSWKASIGYSMGTWKISGDEYTMVQSGTALGYLNEGNRSDFSSTEITTYILFPRSDFSEQDPEAAGYNKTIYNFRIWYKDKTADTNFLVQYRKNDETSWTTWDTHLVGDADYTMKFVDLENIDTGYSFQFLFYESSTTKDYQIEKIEISYELAGPSYNI